MRLLVALLLGGLVLQSDKAASGKRATPSLAGQIAALSEPGGYFDTDNLISNERSYLQVLPDLRTLRGGAYIGVGPDQNFSYIAAARPSVAFMLDIRRDSLLLHLLFKALFALSRTRVEYLALLCGRPVPADVDAWRSASIDRLIKYVDEAAVDAAGLAALRARVDREIARTGVPLSDADRATQDRFHRRFIGEGLSLRFNSSGRPPRDYYPTFRELLAARDPGQHHASYLASEEAFQFVKALQGRDQVIPVVGDLSGPRAMAAIGRLLAARGERVSTLYTSNVEQYLFRDGSYPRFVDNLRRLPHDHRSVIVRSVFGGGSGSSSQVQRIADLLDGVSRGRFRWYTDLWR